VSALLHFARDSQLRPCPVLGLPLRFLCFGRVSRAVGGFQSVGGCVDSDLFGFLCLRGQHGDDVGADLGDAAIDKVTLNLAAALSSQFAWSEPANERRAAGENAQLSVEHWQGNKIDGRVENRLFGRDYHALKRFAAIDFHRCIPLIRTRGLGLR